MEAMQPRIRIQPQSRRSPRCYMTIIKRNLSRVFQLQGSQHSFQDCMDYILPELHRKHFTTPSWATSLLSPPLWLFPIYRQIFKFFVFLYFLANSHLIGPVPSPTQYGTLNNWNLELPSPPHLLLFISQSSVHLAQFVGKGE